MDIKFDVFFKKNIGTLYKDNSIDCTGKEANVNIDLNEVSNIYANFKVGDRSFTDLVEIVDLEAKLIKIPFKTDVIKLGVNELEIVAVMKNGDVLPSQTYSYKVDKSLENPDSVEADTNYPVLIELMDLAGNRLIDMDKSIQKVNTSIENMTNEISSYKEATTNALNSDISSYKETTTNELEENFNNYSSNTTSNITKVLDNKIVELDNVVSAKSNELDIKFSTKSNEITEALSTEINKVNTTLTNKVNEVDETLDTTLATINDKLDKKSLEVDNKINAKIIEIDNRVDTKITDVNTSLNNKINEVNEVIEEVELSEQARKEEHTELVNELSTYSNDINNVKDRVDILEDKVTDNEVVTDLKNKVNNHEERITTSEKTIRHQGILLNALNDLDDTISIEEEGTIISLPQSDDGKVIIDELQGNTLVNYCTNGSEELTLNNEINAQRTNVTLTDTVDNSKVDVVCEGNTLILDEEGDEVEAGAEGARLVSVGELEDNKIEIISTNLDNTLSNKKEIQLSEPLRGLPKGICDKFVKRDGKWYIKRSCREFILNGSENWTRLKSQNDNYVSFNTNSIPNKAGWGVAICDKFIGLLPSQLGNNISEGFYNWGETEFEIGIAKSKLSTIDIIGFKQWLSKNPTTVIYQLKTPTYEEITDPTLLTYLDTTHISNNSTIPCNMQIKNSGYNAIVKPSTQYTVAFDTDKSGEVNIGLGGAKTSTTNGVATITTPSTLTDDSLRLYGEGIKASNVRLLEGDKTNYIPQYFEGMKSCFEDKEQDNGSYEVEIMAYNENKSNSIQLQLNEPLRGVGNTKDRFVLKDSKLMIERNCGIREYREGDFELDNTLTDKTNTTYILNEQTYEEISFELQKLILECFENGTLFIDTLIPPTVSVTYSANKPVVAKLNQVDNTANVNAKDIAMTQIAVDFLLMSSLGEEMINFKIKGGTNMSAYFASRIIKGALKYEDVISKYPNYKEDIDLILIAEGYSDLIVEL